jgi:D-alanyl-D-alanine carboxypeptidase/D-alanyl-D-alanine-endopeptidase (penicillin-binding protein 4)
VTPSRAKTRAGELSTIVAMRSRVGLIALAAVLAVPVAAQASPAVPGTSGIAGGALLPGPDLAQRSSPALARAAASGTINRSQLRRKLKRLARQAPGSSGFYVYDTDARNRRVLFDRKEGKQRKLASNTKLFTTAAALDRLGADGRIETVLHARGSRNGNGRLEGDLFLAGGGDPTLGKSEVRELARRVKRAGIIRVKGRIVADDTVFDRRRGVPDSGFGPSPYIAPLSGLVYAGSTYSMDPAREAADALKSALKKRGVKVTGGVKLGRTPSKLAARRPLASLSSPTIAAIAGATNKPSNNFYAEMLLKRIWATDDRRGTTRGGAKASQRFARSLGSKISQLDGSGLSDNNRSAPRSVVRLLAAMLDHPARQAFHGSLPRAGREGTLDERMEGTAAAGRCRAKTGTITGVSALSGYCNSGRGRVAFSLLMNGVYDYGGARRIQDKMTIEIARYRP